MPALSPERVIEAIRETYRGADLAAVPFRPRRGGASRERYARFTVELARSFDYLDTHDRDNLTAYADKALALGSWMYVVGAEAEEWQRWLALASFGAFCERRTARARSLSVLATDWDFVDSLSGVGGPDLSDEERVVARLSGVSVPPDDGLRDPYGNALASLEQAIRQHQFDRVDAALLTLCEFWLEMAAYLHDPNPERSPEFEPAMCAVVALAVREGYAPRALTEDCQSFLGPGLQAKGDHAWFAEYMR